MISCFRFWASHANQNQSFVSSFHDGAIVSAQCCNLTPEGFLSFWGDQDSIIRGPMMGDWGDGSCSDPNLILQASCFDRMMYDGLEVGSYRSEIPRYAAQHDTGWRSTDPVPTHSRQI